MIFYKISLSNGESVDIDQKEFDGVVANLNKGNFIKTKQGIFNTSFVITITPFKKESSKKIEGYIDEKTGKFIATTYQDEEPKIDDEFNEPKRLK